MTNMKIRGADAGQTSEDLILKPNGGHMIIVDSIERDNPIDFQYEVTCAFENLDATD